MEISFDQHSETLASLKVNILQADYQESLNKKIKEYSKKVALKGFRPGKVPQGLINKMLGKDLLAEEVGKLLSDSIRNYIQDNKLTVVGDPLPTDDSPEVDWNTQKDFAFEFTLGLVPPFDLAFDQLTLETYEVAVSDELMNDTLERIRSDYGKVENPETVAEGDFVYGKLTEVLAEGVEQEPFSLDVLIPTKQVKSETLPLFLGQGKDALIHFQIQDLLTDSESLGYLVGKPKEEAAALTGDYTFVVDQITRRIPVELDQELFDKIFPSEEVNTEEAFREKIKSLIGENYKREAENHLKKQIEAELVEKVSITLPTDFLKNWLTKNNPDNMEANDFDKFTKELRWSLIRNKIADDNSIVVKEDEVISFVMQMFSNQFGLGNMPMDENMRQTLGQLANRFLTEENGRNFENVYFTLMKDRALEVVRTQVNPTVKAVSRDEFEEKIGLK